MVDFIFLEQKLNAFAHAIRPRRGYALPYRAKIGFGIFHFNAVVFCMIDVFKHLRAFKQGFCRNTAPVKAYTAQAFFFHHTHFHAQLRARIAAT